MAPRISVVRNFTNVVAILGIVGASLLCGAVGPVSAAGEILVSLDGVNWAGSLPHALFSDAAALVPLGTHTTTVYLKNSSDRAGFLRLSVRNVGGSTGEYARALSVKTTTPGYPDFPVTVSDARPCRVLIDALRVEPGETVALTSTLRLGNLNGHVGQNEQLDLDMIVSLSEAAALTTPLTECSADGTTIPVTATATATPTPESFLAANSSPGENRLFIDWLPYAALILGAVAFWFLFLLRRRRRHADDNNEFGDSEPRPDEFHFLLDDDETL